jgi:hypothetical protein
LQRLDDRLGDAAGHGRIGQPRQNDGEFVPAEPRDHLGLVEHAGDPRRDRLQHVVARCMPEQVVHLLEPIEIETQHAETARRGQRRLNLLVELLVEAAAVGDAGERVVVGEEADVLLGLLARLQVADGDGAVQLAGKIEGTQDQLDRHLGAVGAAQFAFDRLVRPLDQLQPRAFLGEEFFQGLADHAVGRRADQPRETLVHGDDGLAIADEEPLDRGVGEPPHPLDFELGVAAIAHLDGDAGQGEDDDDEARQRHRHREPAGGNRGRRELDARVRNDRDRGHRGEVERADRKREQQCAESLPLQPVAQADRQGDGADQHGERDRRHHQDRIPGDVSLDLERRHAGEMHRHDAGTDDRTADPGCRPTLRIDRDRQAGGGRHDRDDQGEDGQRNVVGGRQRRGERQHGNEMGRPDAKPRRRRGDDEPGETHASARSAHVVEQADRRERGERANRCCQTDETKVVLGDDAIVDGQHANYVADGGP